MICWFGFPGEMSRTELYNKRFELFNKRLKVYNKTAQLFNKTIQIDDNPYIYNKTPDFY